MNALLRSLIFISVVLIGTGADIYAARLGVPGMGLHIAVIFLAAATLCYFAFQGRALDIRFSYAPLLIFSLLIGWSLLSTLLSDDPELALVTVLRYITIFVSTVILLSIAGRGRAAEGALEAGLHCSIFILVGTILIDVVQPGTFSKLLTRPAGLAENPNGAAQMLAMLFTALYLLNRDKMLSKMFLFSGLITLAGILLTLSRGGFLFVLILGTATILFKLSSTRNFGVSAAAIAIAIIGLIAFQSLDSVASFQNQTTMTRLQRLTDLSYYTDTSDSRYELARLYFSSASPFFGMGPGASAFFESFGGATHNTVLKVYWESGAPGAVFYFMLILGPAVYSRTNDIVLYVIVALLLSVLTNYNLDNRLFYLLVLLAYQLAQLQSAKRAQPPEAGARERLFAYD